MIARRVEQALALLARLAEEGCEVVLIVRQS